MPSTSPLLLGLLAPRLSVWKRHRAWIDRLSAPWDSSCTWTVWGSKVKSTGTSPRNRKSPRSPTRFGWGWAWSRPRPALCLKRQRITKGLIRGLKLYLIRMLGIQSHRTKERWLRKQGQRNAGLLQRLLGGPPSLVVHKQYWAWACHFQACLLHWRRALQATKWAWTKVDLHLPFFAEMFQAYLRTASNGFFLQNPPKRERLRVWHTKGSNKQIN